MAENGLKLLNCTEVNGKQVLFYDGNMVCLQRWQYGVIFGVCLYVIPFFIVLLFSPKLLEQKKIGVLVFMLSFLIPLIMAIPIIYLYVKEYKRYGNEVVACEGASRKTRIDYDAPEEKDEHRIDTRELLVDVVFGPYRSDSRLGKPGRFIVFHGICWEGVINMRRLVLILQATFINNTLTKHIYLTISCFAFLLIHLKASPFKSYQSNVAESLSLSLLLNLAIVNLVKSTYFESQVVPRASGYAVIVVFEWFDALAVVILPTAIVAMLAVSLLVNAGGELLGRTAGKTRSRRNSESPTGEYSGSHLAVGTRRTSRLAGVWNSTRPSLYRLRVNRAWLEIETSDDGIPRRRRRVKRKPKICSQTKRTK